MGYDCIVCADVLEHLRSPENVLRQFRDLVNPGGRILLSIPNIAHAGVIAELIGGEFEYRKNGLLDETHVHFFTRNSLLRMITQEGFSVTFLDTVKREIPLSEFREIYVAQLSHSMAETIFAQTDALTYQFIIELSPEERSKSEDRQVSQNFRARFSLCNYFGVLMALTIARRIVYARVRYWAKIRRPLCFGYRTYLSSRVRYGSIRLNAKGCCGFTL